jgi:hypothetical protein
VNEQAHAIELGDVVDVLAEYNDDAFDAVLCDPPYGLSFMGRRWDYDVPSVALWREVLRVCKPGAPLIAFGGTRTYHRMVVNIEDAGFEIRDCLAWMYGSGFPKSLAVDKALDAAAGAERPVIGSRTLTGSAALSTAEKGGTYASNTSSHGRTKEVAITAPATALGRQWAGYGTALKPALEPAVLARKPLEGTVAENVTKWGVGALAIDACRIGDEPIAQHGRSGDTFGFASAEPAGRSWVGRWPANVILDEDAGRLLDEQSGDRAGMSGGGTGRRDASMFGVGGITKAETVRADSGGASRFFYCPKANRRERDAGCEDLPALTGGQATDREDDSPGTRSPRAGAGRTGGARNHHPTVKPIALCEYLARLILPPTPGAILVPFAGSGSEMIGCLRAGWPVVVGIEREGAYVEIARRRLVHALRTANERVA